MAVTEQLAVVLAQAAAASPGERIALRDQLASHGPAAISAVTPWLDDPRLAAFAVRVITKAGAGSLPQAIDVLMAHRPIATSSIRADIDFALEQLGAKPKAIANPATARVSSIPPDAGEDWPGFQTEEFGQIAGTSWRSRDGRTSLAAVVTRALRYQHPHFESFGIGRSPEVHFALRERYQQGDEHGQGWRAAKLFVYAHAVGLAEPLTRQVAAGLYIEKGDGRDYGPVDDRWDWSLFVAALLDSHVQRELSRVMVLHDLRLGDYSGGRHGYAGSVVGFTCRFEDGSLVLRDSTGLKIGEGWPGLHERLRNLQADRWHDVLIWRSWPAEDAVAAGRSFATSELLPVLSGLASVYLDVVGPVLPRIAAS